MSINSTPITKRDVRSLTPNLDHRLKYSLKRQKHNSQKDLTNLIALPPPKFLRNYFIYFSLHVDSWGNLEKEITDIKEFGQLELYLRVPPGKYGFRNTGKDEIWHLLGPKCIWLNTIEIKMERGGVDKYNTRFQNIFDKFNGITLPNMRHLTIMFKDNMELNQDNFDYLIKAINTFQMLETCHLVISFYEYGRRNIEKSSLKGPPCYDIFLTSSKRLRELRLIYKRINCGDERCYVNFMKHLVAQTKDSLNYLELDLKPDTNHNISQESLNNFYDLLSRLKNLKTFKCRFPGNSNRNSINPNNFLINLLPAFNFPNLTELELDLNKSRLESKQLCLLFTDLFINMKTLETLKLTLKNCDVKLEIFKLFRDLGAENAKNLRRFSIDLTKIADINERHILYLSQGLNKVKTLRETNIVVERKNNKRSDGEISKLKPQTLNLIGKTVEKFFIKPLLARIEQFNELIFNFQITWGREWHTIGRIDYYTDQSKTNKDYYQFSLLSSYWPLDHMMALQTALHKHCHNLDQLTYEPGYLSKNDNTLNETFYWKEYIMALIDQNPNLIKTRLRFYGDNKYCTDLLVLLRTKPKLVRAMLSAEVSDIENVAESVENMIPESMTEFRICASLWYEERIVELSKKKNLWFNFFYALKKNNLLQRFKVRRSIITELATEYFVFKLPR